MVFNLSTFAEMSEKEISREYKKVVTSLEATWRAMLYVSRAAAGRNVEPRKGWAALIFTRLCVLTTSLLEILPESKLCGENSKYWSFSSIAIITRAILECCILFYYLGVENPSEEEWRARLNLMHLHDAAAREDMFRTLFENNDEADKIANQKAELIERLELAPQIIGLSEKGKRHILRGQEMRFEIQDDVIAKMGQDVKEFRAWYKVLSAHVHSYSLSFHRAMLDDRGKGVENTNEKGWAASAIFYLQLFLSKATTWMIQLFPDISDPRIAGYDMSKLPPDPMAANKLNVLFYKEQEREFNEKNLK